MSQIVTSVITLIMHSTPYIRQRGRASTGKPLLSTGHLVLFWSQSSGYLNLNFFSNYQSLLDKNLYLGSTSTYWVLFFLGGGIEETAPCVSTICSHNYTSLYRFFTNATVARAVLFGKKSFMVNNNDFLE